MKTLSVTYNEAQRYLQKGLCEKHKEKFVNLLALRSRGGFYAKKIKEALLLYKKDGSEEGLVNLMLCMAKYLLGSRFCVNNFPGIVKISDRYLGEVKDKRIEYVPKHVLFHLTPVENLKSIKKKGIVSENGEVYLSDDLGFIRDYAFQKTLSLERDVRFCLLKVNAKKLSKDQKLYYKYINVCYTGNIGPEYIIWE